MGDSYNDLSMFEINKHNFVIDKGTEVLNKKVNYVVDFISYYLKIMDKK